MVKRRKRGEEAVSLFPFLSILACVIGVLTLMITALALGQLEEESHAAEQYERSDEYKRLAGEIEVDEQELERIKQTIADAEQMRIDLGRAKEELEKLQAEQLAKAKVETTKTELAEEANRLQEQIAKIEAKLADLEKLIQRINEELLRRKAPPKEAEIVIRENDRKPSANVPDLQYTFVECRSDGVVIYDGGKRTPVARKQLGNREQPYFQLVERTAEAQDKGACLLFLVRGDAYGTYSDAQRIARSRRCLTSKLPVPGQGDIDVSVFGESAAE